MNIVRFLTFAVLLASITTVQAQTTLVKYGDSLSKIAQRELGAANRWPELCELNKAAISNCNALRAGQEIRLPTEPTAEVPSSDISKSFTNSAEADATFENARELITNGDFNENAEGWAAYNSSLAVVEGELIITGNSSNGQAYVKGLEVEQGKVCRVSATLRRGSAAGAAVLRVNGQGSVALGATETSAKEPEALVIDFYAGASAVDIVLLISGNGEGTVFADNVSLKCA